MTFSLFRCKRWLLYIYDENILYEIYLFLAPPVIVNIEVSLESLISDRKI
jgi:hypothetical protein